MRRFVLLLVAMLSLLLLGAKSKETSVLPPSVQGGFQHIMQEVNQKHALGAGVRITDIAIQKQQVVLQFDFEGEKLELRLVHREGTDSAVESRYFGFSYDEKAWRGHHTELLQLARLLDEAFPRTPWFIAIARVRAFGLLEGPLDLELSPRVAMTLFASSWLVGLLGTALLLRRRRASG